MPFQTEMVLIPDISKQINKKIYFAFLQKVNESGMEDNSPLPPPVSSLQEKPGRVPRVETPVDSMLKDMATIIFCTFLLAGWVAFIITYPKVNILKRDPTIKLVDRQSVR